VGVGADEPTARFPCISILGGVVLIVLGAERA
jgi:hypothetical protein